MVAASDANDSAERSVADESPEPEARPNWTSAEWKRWKNGTWYDDPEVPVYEMQGRPPLSFRPSAKSVAERAANLERTNAKYLKAGAASLVVPSAAKDDQSTPRVPIAEAGRSCHDDARDAAVFCCSLAWGHLHSQELLSWQYAWVLE